MLFLQVGYYVIFDFRIKAGLICAILEAIQLAPSSNAVEKFLRLVSLYDFWKTVFTAVGKEKHIIQKCHRYKEAWEIIVNIVRSFKTNDVSYTFLQRLKKQKLEDKTIGLLILNSTETEKSLRDKFDEMEKCFRDELNDISCCVEVLDIIQYHLPNFQFKSNSDKFKKELNQQKENVMKGKTTVRHLIDKTVRDRVEKRKLSSKCSVLQPFINSQIFWRSFKEECEEKYKPNGTPKEDTEGSSDENDIEKRSMESNFEDTYNLLQILLEDGISRYNCVWNSLIHEHDLDVSFAFKLLQGSNINQEFEYAGCIINEEITQKIKDELILVHDIHDFKYKVDAVKRSFEVFNISLNADDKLSVAILAFDKMAAVGSEDEQCTFSLAVSSLTLVNNMSDKLSKETIDILHALSECSSVVEFLRDIAEEDIRNLIDAVEDISEQHVQESTVSALIEVKSFLQPVISISGKDQVPSQFITDINEQTSRLSRSASGLLPAKINECMDSLHNLRLLYGNVANRGEITAEIIANIVSSGSFEFDLRHEGMCDFIAIYKTTSRQETHTKTALVDLRSRALLLMNTRSKKPDSKQGSEILEKFVGYVDLSSEIAEICEELHHSGNMDFFTYRLTTDCLNLGSHRDYLQKVLKNWSDVLQTLRDDFYLLNFIHGPEIHTLYNFFEKQTGEEEVITILRFIHPEIEHDKMLHHYKYLKALEKDITNAVILKCFAQALHYGYETNSPIQRPFPLKQSHKKVTDVVQNKVLYVAALDENSNQVVKTLLALYRNTVQMLPEPHQVLICTAETTWNELELLLSRCFGSYSFSKVRQLFCITNIEMLTNELQFRLVEELRNINTEDDFLLSIICRGSSQHPFIDELNTYVRKAFSTLSDDEVRQTFQTECPEVKTYTSVNPGLGKSNRIRTNAFQAQKKLVKIHISGHLNKQNIIEKIAKAKVRRNNALHLDIASINNTLDLDMFVFELIILRYVTAGFSATCLRTDFIFLEVANTISDSLRNSLNTVMSFKREHLKWNNYADFIVSKEINSPVQIVCHYMHYSDDNSLNKRDIVFNGRMCEPSMEPLECRKLLKKYFKGDSDLSFSIVNTFLFVLADQLKKMSCSSYFRVARISEMVGNKTATVRSTLFNALVDASKEFASRSITACRATQLTSSDAIDVSNVERDTKPVTLSDLVKKRLDGMIRWEASNHLI